MSGYGITLQTAQAHLDQWLEAELEITTHQAYTIGSRQLTMADLGEVRKTIDYWANKVQALENAANGSRSRRVILRDL